MSKRTQQILLGLVGFLSAWQASSFDLEYRSILGAILAAAAGYAAPAVRRK